MHDECIRETEHMRHRTTGLRCLHVLIELLLLGNNYVYYRPYDGTGEHVYRGKCANHTKNNKSRLYKLLIVTSFVCCDDNVSNDRDGDYGDEYQVNMVDIQFRRLPPNKRNNNS